MDITQSVYCVLAPMIFLMIWKHSVGACVDAAHLLVPEKYLAAQMETLLHGVCLPPAAGATPIPEKKT